MSRSDVEAEVLAPMQAAFLPPRDLSTDETKLTLKGYIAVLAQFDGPTLAAAWADVLASHKTRAWPVPGVIAASAFKARKDRAPSRSKATSSVGAEFEDNGKLWDAVKRTPLACEAAKLNVAWALKCAVLHDGQRPHQIDLRRFVRGKMEAETTAMKIQTGQRLTRAGRDIGVMANPQQALAMWTELAVNEAATQREIEAKAKGAPHVA